MNTEHLQSIINNYLDRFAELNGREHAEYYKWQIAFRFKSMMDDALDASNKEFPEKLYDVKKLTQNIIDSYTQPFNGLVEFSKREPETVRRMFKDLFQAAEAGVKEKEIAIQSFLDSSHRLRDEYFHDSYLYNDDLHSVTGYLFLYDPEHNYLYKASHCRVFADCVEFYDDWGYGADTKLDVFFRMCDEVLMLIMKNETLLAANSRRYIIDPDGMHPDYEKHILLFDLIYCCSTYGLFKGIDYTSPKTGDRKLILERREKAEELAAVLQEANKKLDSLNEAKRWLNETLKPGVLIRHKSFGEGSILQADEEFVVFQFPDVGRKKMGTVNCFANGFVRFADDDLQTKLQKYREVLRKDQQINNEVKWAEKNLSPYLEYLS